MSDNARILALIGTTASGKSDFAIRLAQACNAAILSCDSLLVYQELNIGTAKPTPAEQELVRHFGMNLLTLKDVFNAGDFVRYAHPIIESALSQKQPLLIVGGTGFYLKALLCGIWALPPTNAEYRKVLEAQAQSVNLHAKLSALDPEYAQRIPPQDRYRVIRALEIIHQIQKPLSTFLKEQPLQGGLSTEIPIFGIQRNKGDLEQRIQKRTQQMFQQGFVQECKTILSALGYPNEQSYSNLDLEHLPRALSCVGYKEVIQCLRGDFSILECKEKIKISTRQLAKKQRTFFKTFPKPIQWFDFPLKEEECFEQALQFLR